MFFMISFTEKKFKMLRPAGMSSEEEDDDDYYLTFSSDMPSPQINQKHPEVTSEENFFICLKNSNIDEMKMMIENGFSVDTPLESGWSALLHSCSLGKSDVVKFLLESGANINFQRDLFTPIMAVCSSKANEDELVKCIEYLFEYKADINQTDKYGTTALMLAVREGHLKLISKLINAKCNIDRQDSEKWTALYHAILKNNVEAVKLLVDAGCKLNTQDSKNRTVYELAEYFGYKEIANIVRAYQDVNSVSEENTNEPVQSNEDPVERLLHQLPSNNGKNDMCGFPSDVISLVNGMGLSRYARCFKEHNVQLGEFLLISEERLKEIGVTFSYHRQQILLSIKKFHLREWNKRSLGLKPLNVQLEIEDADRLIAIIIKHLHVLKATIHYARKNMPIEIKPELFETTEGALHQSDLIIKELSSINSLAKHKGHNDKIIHVDLIKRKEPPSVFNKIMKIASISFVLGIAFWKSRMIMAQKLNTL